jgi:hypothetical protein
MIRHARMMPKAVGFVHSGGEYGSSHRCAWKICFPAPHL